MQTTGRWYLAILKHFFPFDLCICFYAVLFSFHILHNRFGSFLVLLFSLLFFILLYWMHFWFMPILPTFRFLSLSNFISFVIIPRTLWCDTQAGVKEGPWEPGLGQVGTLGASSLVSCPSLGFTATYWSLSLLFSTCNLLIGVLPIPRLYSHLLILELTI